MFSRETPTTVNLPNFDPIRWAILLPDDSSNALDARRNGKSWQTSFPSFLLGTNCSPRDRIIAAVRLMGFNTSLQY